VTAGAGTVRVKDEVAVQFTLVSNRHSDGDPSMRVLICGAGIAGLTLAWCLERREHEPVVVERVSQLRDDGYMIDFFGSGFDMAERLVPPCRVCADTVARGARHHRTQ